MERRRTGVMGLECWYEIPPSHRQQPLRNETPSLFSTLRKSTVLVLILSCDALWSMLFGGKYSVIQCFRCWASSIMFVSWSQTWMILFLTDMLMVEVLVSPVYANVVDDERMIMLPETSLYWWELHGWSELLRVHDRYISVSSLWPNVCIGVSAHCPTNPSLMALFVRCLTKLLLSNFNVVWNVREWCVVCMRLCTSPSAIPPDDLIPRRWNEQRMTR